MTRSNFLYGPQTHVYSVIMWYVIITLYFVYFQLNHSNNSPRALQEKLFQASKQGDTACLHSLLSHKSLNLDHIGHGGKTALYHAINQQHIGAVKALLDHGVNVEKSSFATYHRDHAGVQLMSSDEPPLVTAARVDNADIVELLLQAGASVNSQALCHTNLSGVSIQDRTALHFACENVNVTMVSCLLRFHADVNIKDKQCESAVHVAVRCHKCSDQSEIVKLLCQNQSDVNSVNKIECPPLYLASFYGCVQKVNILLSYGANVNKLCERESSYGSALHIAAMKDRYELSDCLISSGAKLSLHNGLSYTPLNLNINAHSKSDVASLLLYHGAETDGLDKFNYTVLGSIIRNMRFDCEVLAKILVNIGYDLGQDLWLSPAWLNDSETEEDSIEHPHISIPSGRISKLCDWLREKQCNPLELSQLCRIAIRRHLSLVLEGRSIVRSIFRLPLPVSIKDYIALGNIVEIKKITE